MPTSSIQKRYVLILDDHPLVGRGIAHFLASIRPDLDIKVVTHWEALDATLRDAGCPSLLIADVWLADGSSLQALMQWQVRNPGCPWLAISGDDDPSVQERVRSAGAQGFVHKKASPDTFSAAYACVLSGQSWFKSTPDATLNDCTPREWEVTPLELGLTTRQGDILLLLLRGLPNKRIALLLGITESTVKEHVTSILGRLGVHTRVELMTVLRGRRLVCGPGP